VRVGRRAGDHEHRPVGQRRRHRRRVGAEGDRVGVDEGQLEPEQVRGLVERRVHGRRRHVLRPVDILARLPGREDGEQAGLGAAAAATASMSGCPAS